MLLDDALRAVDIVRGFDGPMVDVGSGGGSPGIPLAVALPEREVTLLEAERRKCDFLEQWAPPNARVVWGRAEEQEVDVYGVALAKALAQPPTALEWACRSSARAVLPSSGSARAPTSTRSPASRSASAEASRRTTTASSSSRRSLRRRPVFPRRAGVAKKRPLA